MPNINIHGDHFVAPFAAANGAQVVNVSSRRCIKFATTVGISSVSGATPPNVTHLAISSYKAMAMRCTLDFSQPNLRPRPEYRTLDPTERANLSYWVGMTFAGISADRLLGVVRLIHATRTHGVVKVNPKSKSLADLIGRDAQGRYHVVEAKGRQQSPSPATQAEWKAQASTVASVQGNPVSTRSHCYTLIASPLTCAITDPPIGPNPVDLNINPDEFGRNYYRPFVEFLATGSFNVVRDGRNFTMKPITFDPIEDRYVYIGLEDAMVEHYNAGRFPIETVEFEDSFNYVGRDGVAVAYGSNSCGL